MARSPADAISRAVERTQKLLFPFNANKWFALGFTVFMAQCGEGGGGSLPNFPGGSGSSSAGGGPASWDFRAMLDEAMRTLNKDLALYVTLGVVGITLGLGIWLLVMWFSSRAKLMFVESVIWDRVELGKQWDRAAKLGMSLCKFRLLLSLCGGLLLLAGGGAGVLLALPSWQSGDFFGPAAVLGYAVIAGTALLIGLPLWLTQALLDDFVVPFMVLRNVPVGEAWQLCRAEVLSGNVGGVALFYVLRIALAFAISIVAMVLTCVTCCATAIPYVGTVLLLPVLTFSRLYPLCYMAELGIAVFPQLEPSWAEYEAWRFPR